MPSFDTYGFFEDIWPLDQTNWASYFGPVTPDGVLAGIGDELKVYADSTGMSVHVMPGECRVRSHRGALDTEVDVTITASDPSYDRIDLIVARVTYGAPSTMEITVKTGTPAQTPVCPAITQTPASVWEIPLAQVLVTAGAVTIAAGDVTDRRFTYIIGGAAAIDFTGESLVAANDWEYRNSTEINSLEIELPQTPGDIFICSVCFTASASFTGVTFSRNGAAYTVKTTDGLNFKSVRYNLIIWWDGAYFWCGARAV